jgi:hypothetical protein
MQASLYFSEFYSTIIAFLHRMARPEQSPTPGTEPGERKAPGWDIGMMAKALGTAPEEIQDIASGSGTRFTLSDEPKQTIEVFPGSSTARLTTPDAQLTLYRLESPRIDEHGVLLFNHRQDTTLRIGLGMAAVFGLGLAGPTSEAPEETTEVKQDRLTVNGRVGAAPRFRTTRNGTLIAQFPVAVHEENGETSWHRVVVFNDRARKLQGPRPLEKGQSVEVIGYKHVREQQTREGETKVIEEVYATLVKPR